MKDLCDFFRNIRVFQHSTEENLFKVIFPKPINAVVTYDMKDFPPMSGEDFIDWLNLKILDLLEESTNSSHKNKGLNLQDENLN